MGIKKGVKNGSGVDGTLFLLIFVSALLMALGAVVIQRLSGALEQMAEVAMPPHYLQMHVGEIDPEAVESFAQETGLVAHFEIQDMVNIEGINIDIQRKDGTNTGLSDSLLDNYFVKQNQRFDYLLDLHNLPVEMAIGEIGVPVGYAKEKNIGLGDEVRVSMGTENMRFSVAHIIRDAQMGSSLASSIRFLVSDQDFDALNAKAFRREAIIAFRLYDEGKISAFEGLYKSEDAHMPQNGVGITLPLIMLLNGIGDGLLSGLLILVSAVLMTIAVFNMRFAILSALEEEAKAIGTLRAIGLNQKDIAALYKGKYRFLAIGACTAAYCLSFVFSKMLLKNIALNFGLSEPNIGTYFFPLLAVGAVYVFVMVCVHQILKGISRLSVMETLTLAPAPRRFKGSLTLHDLWYEKKSWFAYGALFFLVAICILVPMGMYMTLTSPHFVKYVGAAKSDIRISIENTDETVRAIEKALSESLMVDRYHAFDTHRGQLEGAEGKVTFLLESGDYSAFPVEMQEGHLPATEKQMAISALNQKRLGVSIGETLHVTLEESLYAFEIVGIYQDITNGGMTSKIAQGPFKDATHTSFYVNLKEKSHVEAFVNEWGERFPQAKILSVERLVDQTLGTITSGIFIGIFMIWLVALFVVGLMAYLFMTLKRLRNRPRDSGLLILGFRKKDIKNMYLKQTLMVSGLGILLGGLVAYYGGSMLISMVLAILGIGLTHLTFIIQPLYFILLGCICPVMVGLTFTWLVTEKIEHTLEATYE